MPSQTLRYLLVLAIGQNIGWGTVGLLTVLGADIAASLGLPLPIAFAGTTVFYITMGVCAPILAPAFIRFGARNLLVVGSLGAAFGFMLLAFSQNAMSYLAAWTILGLAGSASLSTASHIALNQALGSAAGRAIGLLMIASGLSSTIFWPITAYLGVELGWRLVCAVYAFLALGAALLYHLGMPRPERSGAVDTKTDQSPVPPTRSTFYLVAAAISLNAFVTFGFSGIVIELFKSMGLPLATATALASSLGIIQISARALDFLGGKRWDGLYTALVAAPTLLFALILLLVLPNPSWPAILAFVVIYGFGSGALAVSRATMPLVFYDRAEYARAASRIALPLNILSAIAPPILIALLENLGVSGVLTGAIACSTAALALILVLHRRRPSVAPA